jgi:hypothetical protein
MKKGQTVSLKQTTDACYHVQKELYTIGLWYENSKLVEADIIWFPYPIITIPDAAGFLFHGTTLLHKMLGYKPGHIYIPKYVVLQFFKQERGSLREILRHEYAHVLAHYYPEFIEDNEEFEKVFGGAYYHTQPIAMEDAAYITDYARKKPMEDFAETFMVYLRRKGVLPDGIKNKKLKRKWNFITKTIRRIQNNK